MEAAMNEITKKQQSLEEIYNQIDEISEAMSVTEQELNKTKKEN